MATEQSVTPAGVNQVTVATVTPSVTHSWMSIEEAAAAMGVSHRTIHRRIEKETIESRLDGSGRRWVLVAVSSPAGSHSSEIEIQRQSDSDSRPTAAPGDSAGADLVTATQLVRRAEEVLASFVRCHATQARAASRGARLGWFAATAMAAGLAVTVTVAAAWRARDQAQVDQVVIELNRARAQAARNAADRDRAMVEMGRAIEQADARTASAQIAAAPTTRPARGEGWVVKLASVFEKE